jgi:DNA polymerase III delta prime subunit
MKNLPCGLQIFEEIIKDDYIYIDKTKYLINLIKRGKLYLFSRPRRFGKTLTLNVLKALFEGKKELFKGLYAEEWINREDFKPSPVILLDMSKVVTDGGLDVLRNSIGWIVADVAKSHKVEIDNSLPPGIMLANLISNLAENDNKVVVLVDEYDKPLTDFLTKDETIIKDVKEILRNFYIHIKANEQYIKFVFITGITKFSRVGIFSTLNNLTDVSFDEEYGTMCGYTEAEIIKYFPDYLEETAKEMQISIDELIVKMRNYYDGFCFNGIDKLYNPYSTLLFLREKDFFNYWMDTGTSKYVAEYLEGRHLTVEQFRNFSISEEFAYLPGEIDTATPESYLYQSGYLTLRPGSDGDYFLDYPNTEVLNSMSRLLAENIVKQDYNFFRSNLLISLENTDIEEIKEIFNALLASIPYDDYVNAARQSVKLNRLKIQVQEWLYRSTILAFLRGCDIVTVAEMHTNFGRPDLVISHKKKTFIIELKVAYEPEDVEKKLEEARTQIIEKEYAKPYPNSVCIAIVIDDKKRQIEKCEQIPATSI